MLFHLRDFVDAFDVTCDSHRRKWWVAYKDFCQKKVFLVQECRTESYSGLLWMRCQNYIFLPARDGRQQPAVRRTGFARGSRIRSELLQEECQNRFRKTAPCLSGSRTRGAKPWTWR